jgi:hypothetical protein
VKIFLVAARLGFFVGIGEGLVLFFLQNLAKEGALFETAVAPSSWTVAQRIKAEIDDDQMLIFSHRARYRRQRTRSPAAR